MCVFDIEAPLLVELRAIVGPEHVITDERREAYSHDEFSERALSRMPGAAVRPGSTAEVSALMRLAARHGLPVTPRGGGTGLCGGCVPAAGGLVISLERMNQVLEVDEDNLMAVVQAGVTLRQFYAAIEDSGLFFPPHPGDEGAMLGGLISTNAGGARAVKYGVIRTYVRGLEVVLPDGRITRLGGKLMKSSMGYSLMNLFTGAEGTLGIITGATLNLTPPPAAMHTLVVPFARLEDAIACVPRILKSRIVPMAVEFIDLSTIQVAASHLRQAWPSSQGQAHLMFILDSAGEDELLRLSQQVAQVCMDSGALEVFVADDAGKQKAILAIRSVIYESMRPFMFEILDLTVPRARIADFVRAVRALEQEFDTWLPTYGHAADGNVHTHIMRARPADGVWQPIAGADGRYPAVRARLHAAARGLDGIISGEHGIGLVKKEYMPDFLDAAQLELMAGIKRLFDPAGIMNPGKVLPD